MPRPAGRAAVAALVLSMLLAGCGGDDDDTTAATSGTDPVPATTSTASAGGGPAGRETSPGSCDGSIGAETVENVGVPAGATCRLDGTTVTGNRIDGNLQCESNNPVPTGGGNRVQGDKDEQCARL